MQFIVDVREQTPLRRIWRYVGYDEPNYTYTRNGRALLRKLGRLADGPYQIRCHFLLCSGDGVGAPKWGSTNVYTEDGEGRAVYTWDIIDRILDTILESGCIPFVELGFMPEALSSAPEGVPYSGPTAEGWGYPPCDYSRWMDLIRVLARHCLERYGLREVSRWTWELWNEPDIFYWRGSVDEYCRLYDYTVTGLVSVLPQARVAGPGTTSPANPTAGDFLRSFVRHCTQGENAVTGLQGTRLDTISFHTKGGGYGPEPNAPKKTPTLRELLRHVDAGLAIIAEFPELCGHEIILTECDPDGWAAGSIRENPNLAYRNSEYYASYVASAACRLLQTAHPCGLRVDGMLTWAFQFEDREYFAGLRTLSTNGIDKPVLNVFRLLALLGGSRCAVAAETGAPVAVSSEGVEISGIASIDGAGAVAILLAAHQDDWDVDTDNTVTLVLVGLDDHTTYGVVQTTIDRDRANSHTAWLKLGSPQPPDEGQVRVLLEAARLRPVSTGALTSRQGRATLSIELTSHSVTLLQLIPGP
jgi:xylan 1,4-beta-xylosidase